MPTLEELEARIDLLSNVVSQLTDRVAVAEQQTRIRDNQLNEVTRRALKASNDIAMSNRVILDNMGLEPSGALPIVPAPVAPPPVVPPAA